MKNTLIILSFVFSSLSFALPERNLEVVWSKKVFPFYQNLTHGEFKNSQGMAIKYSYLLKDENVRTLVILPGRSEPAMKYAELLYDYRAKGFNIFIMDFQGQGASDRLLKNTDKGHVLSYTHYVRDLDQFITEIVLPRSPKELHLIAHSMGGAVAVLYMKDHPETFKKAALSSPMFQINTEPYSELVAKIYSKVLIATGKKTAYAPGRGPYVPEEDSFETNDHTQSVERFNVMKSISVDWPNLVVGGPTTNWVYKSLIATKDMGKMKIKTPVILFQAGADQIVKHPRQNAFCKINDCQLKHFPSAEHEVLMEKDLIRDEVLREIGEFFGR
jgi:lysophospholipase